jgi:hypothetical protein
MREIKNIANAIVEQRPHFMTWVTVGTTERKINGPTGELKFVPWFQFINFEVEENATSVTQFATMEFKPKGTSAYDTPQEAKQAAWAFIRAKIAENSIFTLVWNDWAEE